jgi:hypothetical protein
MSVCRGVVLSLAATRFGVSKVVTLSRASFQALEAYCFRGKEGVLEGRRRATLGDGVSGLDTQAWWLAKPQSSRKLWILALVAELYSL